MAPPPIPAFHARHQHGTPLRRIRALRLCSCHVSRNPVRSRESRAGRVDKGSGVVVRQDRGALRTETRGRAPCSPSKRRRQPATRNAACPSMHGVGLIAPRSSTRKAIVSAEGSAARQSDHPLLSTGARAGATAPEGAHRAGRAEVMWPEGSICARGVASPVRGCVPRRASARPPRAQSPRRASARPPRAQSPPRASR